VGVAEERFSPQRGTRGVERLVRRTEIDDGRALPP
jgi:hypothetical protein